MASAIARRVSSRPSGSGRYWTPLGSASATSASGAIVRPTIVGLLSVRSSTRSPRWVAAARARARAFVVRRGGNLDENICEFRTDDERDLPNPQGAYDAGVGERSKRISDVKPGIKV